MFDDNKVWLQYFFSLVMAALLALLVRTFVVTAYKVPTGSMQPTLKSGDFIFSTRFDYHLHDPEPSDVIVFSYPQQPRVNYVKRVIAKPGDKVEIKNGIIFINDKALETQVDVAADVDDNPNTNLFDIYSEENNEAAYKIIRKKQMGQESSFGPSVVPEAHVFVLGDNRDASDDSRYWGTVPYSYVHGRVRLIWFSIDAQRKWANDNFSSVRWNRLFTLVH